MIKEITGKDNRILKTLRSLKTRNGRKKLGLYFVEGERIVKDTLTLATENISFVVFSSSYFENNRDFCLSLENNTECYLISDKLFVEISDTKTPQGILMVLSVQSSSLDDFSADGNILILDSVQDPGNMGTIIRTAEAMGISSVFLTKGSTDIYSPKVLRSAMGSAFRTDFYFIDTEDLYTLKDKGYKLYSAALSENSIPLDNVKPEKNAAIIIGNEANGISEEILEISDYLIKIPMTGKIESLNAAIAAAIVMYHFYDKQVK